MSQTGKIFLEDVFYEDSSIHIVLIELVILPILLIAGVSDFVWKWIHTRRILFGVIGTFVFYLSFFLFVSRRKYEIYCWRLGKE